MFQDREIYKTLLEYLVDASLREITPKEVTIAHDVFKKSRGFNAAEDTTVRVHMHNLRKKLDEYYQDEGKADNPAVFVSVYCYRIYFS